MVIGLAIIAQDQCLYPFSNRLVLMIYMDRDSHQGGFIQKIASKKINGPPELDKCIKMAFAVVDFVGKIDELDSLIADFNQYLVFDKWEVIRDNYIITFRRRDRIIAESTKKDFSMSEDEFLRRTFDINIDLIGLDPAVIMNKLEVVGICMIKSHFRHN